MLIKEITFTNPFTDKKVTETHYFHISKADLVEMEMEEHGAKYTDKSGTELTGMAAKLTKIMESEDGKAILAETKDLIRRSYGKKDGNNFRKSKEIWDEFASSEAFSELIFELCTDAEKSAEFMSGVIPNNLDQISAEVRALAAEARDSASTPEPVSDPAPAVDDTPEQPPTTPPVGEGMTAERKAVLDLASTTNPIKLDPTDMIDGDPEYIRAGLASGRFMT